MAEQTHHTSPKIRGQWQEWMRPWTYCPGCNMSWSEYGTLNHEIPCICTEEE